MPSIEENSNNWKALLFNQPFIQPQQLEGTPIQPTIHTTVDPVPSTASEYILPKNISKQDGTPTAIALPVSEFLGIKKDLIKTVIVICIFFSIEVTLWKLFG
ncbi:MAG: hypothetical protein UU25_C0018G0011 [Microgenomates group bacterium GW2011_GWB1_40_9]|nr:MAG: hypothetical protein UU25_C0018G0011 [Microgenomates group bacterium GW2011_GWB1_40_9]